MICHAVALVDGNSPPDCSGFVRAVLNAGHDITLGCIVGSKLVGDHDARGRTLPFQKLSHQMFCSLGIAAALNQDIQNEAVLIHSQSFTPLMGSDDDLVEVPFVTELPGGLPPDIIGGVPAELLRLQFHRLVRDDDGPCRQYILYHAS